MTKKSVELKESKALEELVESYKEKIKNVETIDKFLGEYNPWKGKNFDDLLDDFLEALKKDDKEFSWLKIDNGLYEELKDKKGKAVSIDYGIPSHLICDNENFTGIDYTKDYTNIINSVENKMDLIDLEVIIRKAF